MLIYAGEFLKGYRIFWTDGKSKANNKNAFYTAEKFDTLSSHLIFEDAFWSVSRGSVQLAVYCLVEREASSKNKAKTYRVRWGSSAGKGIIFLFVYRDVLIVFVIAGAGISFKYSVSIVIGISI